MEPKTAEGLIVLLFILLFPIGAWIGGVKFLFWICVAGGIALVGMIIVWLMNVILGVGRWAKLQ